MKLRILVLIIFVAVVAAATGWFAARQTRIHSNESPFTARKILYYQSPMHPWITSPTAGRCTICGMQLEPVFEGQRPLNAEEGFVTLGSNTVQAINVQTDLVTNRLLVRTLRVAGIIDDDDTKHRRLSAYADGRVEQLFVNFVGAEVTTGQPLASFYSPSLLAMESEYLTLKTQKLPNDVSETFQREHARLIDAAAQRLKRLGYSEAQLSALAKKDSAEARTDLLAPMTGTVVSRNVYEGQYVKEGDVLFQIADFSTMWFQFEAYERDLNWLRVGQQVEITTPALPGRTLSAPITFIDPNLNEMTRSAKVRVEIPNPIVETNGRKQRALLHKMYADGAVKIETPVAFTIPRSAVLSVEQPIVYVEAAPGTYEQRLVKLGRTGDVLVEVLDGLLAGERVVTTGNLFIDAQAQLNAAGRITERHATASRESKSIQVDVSSDELTAPQREIVREFLKLTSDLGEALAGDDLSKFNETAPQMHAVVPTLLDSLEAMKSFRPALQKLDEVGHLEKAKDLADARKKFLPFSMAAVELVQQHREAEPFKTIKIFNCPMVNRAIPSAASNGQWIQLEGLLRNPFFGAAMLDCGEEVKP